MTIQCPVGDVAGPACGLSTEPRMRYWKPAPELRPFISGYHLYAVATPPGRPHRDLFQPAWANLRLLMTPGANWHVCNLTGAWRTPGRVSLFGPSSTITWSESESGLLIGAGILPRGWVRLFSQDAHDWANRIEDCEMFGGMLCSAVHDRMRSLVDDEAVPAAFDVLFGSIMRAPGRDDAAIARIEAALVDPEIETVTALDKYAGLSERALGRLARRAFGFPPKLLMRRARFLRSIHALRGVPSAQRASAIDASYTDYSHFVRDSHAFLGMSPQALLRIETPLLDESLDLRKRVLGASAQALTGSAD